MEVFPASGGENRIKTHFKNKENDLFSVSLT